MDKIPITFQAQIYQHTPMENSGFTSCRARVFYTGLNRNGSYMDDSFAEKLINSASGCPVVGLWDTEKQDFTDHSPSDRKRAYGFIPENPNFSWENSYDYDGVERQYASFDIVLWTKAFNEANEIITHPLSMELNPDTINGEFKVINGEYCFYFTSAELLGVCVLGYDVEPCFEGARFIDVEEVNEFKRMFQLDKQQALLTYNNKGETSMEIDEKEKDLSKVEDFTQIRDDDIENIEETPSAEENLQPEGQEEFSKIQEHEEEEPEELTPEEQFAKNLSELERTNEEFKNKIQELEDKVSELEKQNFSLTKYKENKVKEEKELLLKSYSNILTEEDIKDLNIDKYSLEDLDDKLAAMAYRKGYNQNPSNFQIIYTNVNNEENSNDISDIMKKYKND